MDKRVVCQVCGAPVEARYGVMGVLTAPIASDGCETEGTYDYKHWDFLGVYCTADGEHETKVVTGDEDANDYMVEDEEE